MIEKTRILRNNSSNRLEACHPLLLTKFPVSQYIDLLDAYPNVCLYSFISQEVIDFSNAICRESDTRTLEHFHQLLLLTLIARASEQLESRKLPTDIKSLYVDDYERIIRDIEIEREPTGFYLYPNFCRELALCTFRLIPAGAQKVCVHGLARRNFIRWKPVELASVFRLLIDLRGFGPIYEMHTDSRDIRALSQFTPDGWNRFLQRVATLLEMNPQVIGLAGNGWFLDPQLKHVSPELAYLSRLVKKTGGTLLRLGPCSANAIRDAFQFSPKRKQLHAEGKYVPMDYLAVWPRNRLIAKVVP